MYDSNLIIIIISLVVAIVAIYILWSIILYQGGARKGDELQLTTKNILEQVNILFEKKEYALVQLLATKYLERVPGHLDVRSYLARAYYEDKKYNQAIKQCGVILKKRFNDVDIHKLLADCYLKKQLIGKAIKEYEFVYEHRSRDREVVKTLAELYRDSEQLFSSITAYKVLADLYENDEDIANVQSILAELNEEAHDYPAAFEAYKSRLAIYPTDVETNKKLIELFIKIKNYPVAIETLLYMLTFVSDARNLLWINETLVKLYVETEDYEKAIATSEILLDIPGSDKFKIRDDIALFNIKLNRLDTGISILEELSMLSQDGFEVTLQLADAYIQSKEYAKARDKYMVLLDKATPQEAKKVNTLLCDMYISWAIDYAENSKFEESYECLRSATQYNTINSEIYYNVARNNFAQKNYTSAVEAINKANDYDKQNVYKSKYLLLLADCHHELGNFFEEKKALTDLLNYDNKNAEGLYRVGLMYAAQSEIKKAEESFKKAINEAPDMISAKYNLALLYESNNRDKAKELYMEILEQDPTNEEATRGLNELSSGDGF